MGRKASRPGGKLIISRMRLIWREVSGGFWVREITLKRDVSAGSPFPLPGPRLVRGEQLVCATLRVKAEWATRQTGAQGDTEDRVSALGAKHCGG